MTHLVCVQRSVCLHSCVCVLLRLSKPAATICASLSKNSWLPDLQVVCRETSSQLSRGSEVQLKCICKLMCLQRLLRRALLTCLQSVALIKIKAADLKLTDKSEVCSRRSQHWAPRKVCSWPSLMVWLFMAHVQRVGSTSSWPTPSSSVIEKLKMLETASPSWLTSSLLRLTCSQQ